MKLYKNIILLTLENRENMVYKNVSKYGLYECLKHIELYSSLKGRSGNIISYCYETILQLMYPIIPSLASYLLKLKFNNEIEIPKILSQKKR